MFEHGFDESADDRKETFEYLLNAIENIENALFIYKTKDLKKQDRDPNFYGIALSTYIKGYIYQRFAAELCKESASQFAGPFS